MPYIEFNPIVKKVNLKPGGKKEIVLEVNDRGLEGKLDSLSEMIDCKVSVAMESIVVNYSVTINARTNEPVKEYTVDQNGVVKEVKEKPQQIEADLGLPPEKVETKEEKKVIKREIIDEFIKSGLAPSFESDFPKDFQRYIERKLEGETYSKLASELNLSSGKIVEMMDKYYENIAPLAEKWWEWKESKELDGKEAESDSSQDDKQDGIA